MKKFKDKIYVLKEENSLKDKDELGRLDLDLGGLVKRFGDNVGDGFVIFIRGIFNI